MKRILVAAKQAGSAAALVSPAKVLHHEAKYAVSIYALGSEAEAKVFSDLPAQRVELQDENYTALVQSYDGLLTGLTGWNSPEGKLVEAANRAGIPSVAVNDQNFNYQLRIHDVDHLPTVIAMMHEGCAEKIKQDLAGKEYEEVREEAVTRSQVIGWTAYDDFAHLKKEFTLEKKTELREALHLDLEQPLRIFLSQNIHPDTKYLQPYYTLDKPGYRALRERMFDYELKITTQVFEAAAAVGLHLAVKPHPGEEFTVNFTEELAKKFHGVYLPAKSCLTRDLMLAADSVLASRSGSLNEACLLDRNTGAIVPDVGEPQMDDALVYPAVSLGAIPLARSWEEIFEVVHRVCSPDFAAQLAQDRQRFSVDGKAGVRVAKLVKSLVG